MKAVHLKSCGTNSDLGFLTIKKMQKSAIYLSPIKTKFYIYDTIHLCNQTNFLINNIAQAIRCKSGLIFGFRRVSQRPGFFDH